MFKYIFLTFAFLLGVLGYWGYSKVSEPAFAGKPSFVFEVKKGESFSSVHKRLRVAGMQLHPMIVKVFVKAKGSASKIRAGEYNIPESTSFGGILNIFITGKSIQRQITIPEGLNIYEIADLLETAGLGSAYDFLKMVKDPSNIKKYLGDGPKSLEGYLFPETYSFTKYTTPSDLVTMMIANFDKAFKGLAGLKDSSLTKHEIVTFASIVEKETGAPEERPQIASVFHNRLRKGMKLQSDPTIIYGLWEERGRRTLNLKKADILSKTKFNTYVIKALPLGPIANPGKEALQSVLTPSKTNMYYFVSRNDGTHVFSETYEKHKVAVKNYQMNRKARVGKSWRDLKKRKQTN